MTPKDEWPAREVLRIEGFSDAVFTFALTLLVVLLCSSADRAITARLRFVPIS